MTVAAMNFRPFDRGSIQGFFDLRYHGLTIRGCRLISTNGGQWIAFPQRQGEQDGEVKYYELMHLTAPEMDHVRKLVLADLQAQGHFERSKKKATSKPPAKATHRTPEGEDLTEYYSQPESDDIPF
ncbi:hypothetical protein DESC_240063 [Desulfosarcina cetonica]|uniref:hypothetical protein n=1 Tax=Desulfosarcina cetonica TaxID=90730 RepID=UPI0006D20228|nr:hypothetical protein [Desulfosarcina cetonica]VTR64672.1 hypothetical protein DESC_240063 [Desulfosarcina cetonica]